MFQKIIFSLSIFFLALSFGKCSAIELQQQKKTLKTSKSAKSTPNIKSSTKKIQSINFSGTYTVIHQGTEMVITLTEKNNLVTGTFIMNGQQAKINGLVKNLNCTGKIVEDETGISYAFNADKKGDNLNFSFVVPAQNNQVVKLVLKKESVSKVPTNSKNKNQSLIGTWRNTEVLSSGSGALYSSFATDYFVKFSTDGTAFIWTGKSAGGTNGITIDGAKPGSLQQMEWFTEAKTLYLVNPKTKQKAPVSFYAETNRMMLTSGNTKKVYQRVI
ncbi:MAG: hypothetical protein EOP00_14510 [Pedobacter sp.]|nr:MAG: hypothetical protein EOP00_14510 [Pedobacter sp.]